MSDEVCLQVVDLYLAERKRGAAGGNLSSQCVRAAWETSYQWKAERVMAEENCFKVNVLVKCRCLYKTATYKVVAITVSS